MNCQPTYNPSINHKLIVFFCRGSVGTIDLVHIHGNDIARFGRQQIRWWARICTSICYRVDWCTDCHTQFQTARWKYVSLHSKWNRRSPHFQLTRLSKSKFSRSFFQSVCVLGYCLAPVAGALIVCKILLIAEQTKFVFFLRLIATLIGFLWATYGEQ